MLTLERLATLTPLEDLDGRSVGSVMAELNKGIEAAGIEFGEYGFSDQTIHDPEPGVFGGQKWIDVAWVRGGSEGYYVHVTLVPHRHDRETSRLVAFAKTWNVRSAIEITAAASVLLSY